MKTSCTKHQFGVPRLGNSNASIEDRIKAEEEEINKLSKELKLIKKEIAKASLINQIKRLTKKKSQLSIEVGHVGIDILKEENYALECELKRKNNKKRIAPHD